MYCLRCLSSTCSLSRRSFRLPVCQTVSDAGRILLLRVFSRNPRWCEATVPKLSEHQATPLSTISARYLCRSVGDSSPNLTFSVHALWFSVVVLAQDNFTAEAQSSTESHRA